MKQIHVLLALAWFCMLAAMQPAAAGSAVRPTGVAGVDVMQLDPGYWIARQRHPGTVILDHDAIGAQNRRLLADDRSMHDIEGLPASLDAVRVRGWIEARSSRPARTLYDERGKALAPETIAGLMADLGLEAIPASRPTRYGLVVHRADLRTFPTTLRVFSTDDGDTDIDRFQESALFPGTPVAIVHESRDRRWWFVVGNRYAAWIEKRRVAVGSKAEVFGYVRKAPYLVVTGASARTVRAPDLPAVSDLRLEMGVRVPVLPDWPGLRSVNGQAAYAAHVIELPVRSDDGSLRIVPALLPRTADVAGDYLPLTRANIVGQAFKFLGERYGWGNDYGARDCSSFVSEVYRSMGVQLPRNTGDQAASPALNRLAVDPGQSPSVRASMLHDLQPGDLVYIPGHVMLVIGHDRGMAYVIHDIKATAWRDRDGRLVSANLNGVSVTPLAPLRFGDGERYVDRITSVQRIRP